MRAALLVLLAAVASAHAADTRPLVPLYDAAALTTACDEGLAAAQSRIKAMEATRGAGAIFDEWNRLSMRIEDLQGPVYLLSSVHPDKAVRDAAEPCLQRLNTLGTDLFQNEKLYARVKAATPRTAHQAKLKKDLIEGFEDTGAVLPPQKRARAKQIFERLETLRQAFERNIRDDPTTVTFTAAEMDGLSAAYLEAHQADAQGNYVLRLDYPSYVPFMENARSGAARERYYRAKLSEGGKENLALLEEIFGLRKELAGLYGLPSYAQYSLRRKMVRTPQTVEKFLGDVKAAVTEVEKRELEELRAAKAEDLATPLAETKLTRWDVAYYQEKLRRERYAVDQEKLRAYFPTDKAIAYTLQVSQTLYGVVFREAQVPVWHPDVRYYDVLDARTGRFVSGFYLDLYPREGKYNHAAAFPVYGVSRLAGRTPLSALVANLDRKGLNQEELTVVMHEFGHVLHQVLSRVDYNPQAGSNVKVDFAEAPSQMYEEWTRREQPLALFAKVCPGCPHLTHHDIQRLDAARRYGQGTLYARQWLFATFDMALATDPRPPLALWKQLESATPLGHVEGTMFPASFAHIASGYAAGYYGYMWSQVLALDMLTPFEKNMLDPRVGKRYLDTILSQGAQQEESAMVRRFLGREPSSEAFFAEITGRR